MSIPISRRIGSELSRVARRPRRTLCFLETLETRHSANSYIKFLGFQSSLRAASTRVVQKAHPVRRRLGPLRVLAAGSGLLAILLSVLQPITNEPLEEPEDTNLPPPNSTPNDSDVDGLPRYRLIEVKEHGPKSERPWVIYEDKVYDITDWIPGHPGGEVILRAAGGSIEPYWDIFSIHKSPYVKEILEQFIVGKVHPDDLENGRPLQEHIEDPFMLDPVRDVRLKKLTAKPCNAETPGQELAESFLTPNQVFYVRNHMWVPVVEKVEAEDHNITIELPDGDIKTYSIKDLKARFKQHTVTAVLQCSGNRRNDMTRYAKKTNGLQWTVGAISCAKWEGVRLRDVLADAGLSLEDPGEDARHVQFSGLEAYGASIPISTVLDPMGDVLLAFKMNDEPLPRDHGFPVRVIVPGHVAARCVKWVNKIVVSDEESTTTWQRRDYKCFGPNEVKQDWDKYKAIQVMPITSAITRTRLQHAKKPQSGQVSESIEDSVIQIEGYAYSGGGREIQRVDISLDGGMTWDQAQLIDDTKLERGNKAWCWKRWKYETGLSEVVKSSKGESKATLVIKATDDAYNTQPETHKSIYNPRGNLATAWHRVDFDYATALKDHGTGKNKR
ncbi:Oxidoreductase, molybdopterin-binding domain-containing protein [Annulohypoxylon maeteangense]|uniref:Oxidoreductase, molybdopterin-binding domain-containing protein n=1 Tax=Annulohypoxylon maeteangense TaxID=1927788 RepID=UPI00200761F6|nr:Oxidoreductase, molybdopterin-binding domain-containing protein [Annulohypoxylon maeteangense]KAI0881380.1 Oxidoreductase, molybdopterin-binding domain-containing protein [Annulohypoxylon maeteangense]